MVANEQTQKRRADHPETQSEPQGVAERAAAAAARAAEREFDASLGSAFIAGRWAVLITALVVGALRLDRTRGSLPAEIAFGILVAYNVVALGALYGFAPRKTPVILLLFLDLLVLGGTVALTGGASSPFVGLFYLLTLAAALYYDLVGGLILATAATAILLASRIFLPPGHEADFLTNQVGIQHVPGLILTGGFAGYLVGQLKRLHHRRIELEERLLRAWYDERARVREARLDEQARQREADVARAIQLTILAAPPRHPSFEIAVRYDPAREVGGDFYSFFTNRRLGIVVGDVSGKGMAAALVSTSLSHLSYWLRPMEAPRQFMAALNSDLLERVPEATFATMAFAVLDPRAHNLALYNAGHPPPLLIRGNEVQPIHHPNLPLGAFPEVRFVPKRLPFGRGDTLVLYTDGFLEARNAAREELSLEGLQALVHRYRTLPVETLADRLVEETRAFGAVTDDLTLVVVRMQ